MRRHCAACKAYQEAHRLAAKHLLSLRSVDSARNSVASCPGGEARISAWDVVPRIGRGRDADRDGGEESRCADVALARSAAPVQAARAGAPRRAESWPCEFPRQQAKHARTGNPRSGMTVEMAAAGRRGALNVAGVSAAAWMPLRRSKASSFVNHRRARCRRLFRWFGGHVPSHRHSG